MSKYMSNLRLLCIQEVKHPNSIIKFGEEYHTVKDSFPCTQCHTCGKYFYELVEHHGWAYWTGLFAKLNDDDEEINKKELECQLVHGEINILSEEEWLEKHSHQKETHA